MDKVRNATRAGTLTTYRSTAGGMKISDGSQSYEAKFDGKDYARNRDVHSTISLNLIDDSTMEETDKQDGKIVGVTRMAVSQDGNSMKVESADKQRGTTVIYTAAKPP
jgi:hypothetical protein